MVAANALTADNEEAADGSAACGGQIQIDYRCSQTPGSKYIISSQNPPANAGENCYCKLRDNGAQRQWVFAGKYRTSGGCKRSYASMFEGGNCKTRCLGLAGQGSDWFRSLLIEQESKRTIIPDAAPDSWYLSCYAGIPNPGSNQTSGTFGNCGTGINIEWLCSTNETQPVEQLGDRCWCRLRAAEAGKWDYIMNFSSFSGPVRVCQQNCAQKCGNIIKDGDIRTLKMSLK
jgi:hypothetical protein